MTEKRWIVLKYDRRLDTQPRVVNWYETQGHAQSRAVLLAEQHPQATVFVAETLVRYTAEITTKRAPLAERADESK